jgi:hypothetical protein
MVGEEKNQRPTLIGFSTGKGSDTRLGERGVEAGHTCKQHTGSGGGRSAKPACVAQYLYSMYASELDTISVEKSVVR